MRGTFDGNHEGFLIFQRAVTQAIKNGWKIESLFGDFAAHYQDYYFSDHVLVLKADDGTEWEFSWQDVVYRPDFAMAVFGLSDYCINCERYHDSFGDCDAGTGNTSPKWVINLRQMVIAKNPLKYLDENISG